MFWKHSFNGDDWPLFQEYIMLTFLCTITALFSYYFSITKILKYKHKLFQCIQYSLLSVSLSHLHVC